MSQFEYFPQLIEAHRNDLRALAQPLPREISKPSWRRALALRLVHLGYWIEGNRPTLGGAAPGALEQSTGAS